MKKIQTKLMLPEPAYLALKRAAAASHATMSGFGHSVGGERVEVGRPLGTFVVTSTPGQGTTFRVRLPIVGGDGARVDSGARREGAA